MSGPHPELSHLGPLVGFVGRGGCGLCEGLAGMDAAWPPVLDVAN